MWMSRTLYRDWYARLVKAEVAHETLVRENAALQITMDWFRVRITQLEQERAAFFTQYLKVNIPTPTMIANSAIDPVPFHAAPHFQDVGDAEAHAMGISWNPDGTVRYQTTT